MTTTTDERTINELAHEDGGCVVIYTTQTIIEPKYMIVVVSGGGDLANAAFIGRNGSIARAEVISLDPEGGDGAYLDLVSLMIGRYNTTVAGAGGTPIGYKITKVDVAGTPSISPTDDPYELEARVKVAVMKNLIEFYEAGL